MYQEVPPEVDAAARAQAGALMALYDIRYFITFPPIAGALPVSGHLADDAGLCPAGAAAGEAAVLGAGRHPRLPRVSQPAIPFPFRLDLGTAGH